MKKQKIKHRTANEFQKAVEENNIEHWHFKICGECLLEYGFSFKNGRPYWNEACECNKVKDWVPTTWEAVANVYNYRASVKIFREDTVQFWKFNLQ